MADLFDLKALKCKTCGEPLDITKAESGVIKCAVCDSCFTLPKDTADKKVLDFLSQGEHDLDTGRFDDAYSAFSKACELDKTEPEAYWGMALAEFKIQYLKDEVNNRLQPICHEVTDKDFADSVNFLKATLYATDAQRAEYKRKGEEINYIKNEFYKIANTGVKYDCFICVKVSDENGGGRTQDYKAADDIYFELKGKGYKPFFSERELVGVTGADYEARILYALKSSECMLVVCFDEAYLRTKWVKNEYSRYLKLVNDEEKESDSIALVFGDRPVEKLPGKKGKIQGIALNSLTAMERIVSFVDNHTPEAKKRRDEALRKQEEQAKKKAQEDDALRQKLAEQEELFRKQEERFKQLEALLKAQQNTPAPAPSTAPTQPVPVCNPKDYDISGGVLKKYRGTSTHIVIPDGVTSIGTWAFSGCGGLKSVTIPDGVTSIGNGAFSGCSGLTSITIPNGVTSIGTYAFNRCSSLTSITIPNGVTSIEEGAFQDCSKLTNVTIPDSVTNIGKWAFKDCGSLTIYCQAEQKPNGWAKDWNASNRPVVWGYGKEDVISDVPVNTPASAAKPAPTYNPNDFEIENGVLKKYNGAATEVIIPDGVTSIGKLAFQDCSKLTSIIIPNSVTSIGNGAFSNCSSLTNITIPNSVTSIGKWTFYGCSRLTNITISNSVKRICERAFDGCRSLTSIIIPNSVTSIGKEAFSNSSLTNITIPNSVTSIGKEAFRGCRLTNITIPDGVTSIGDWAFQGCSDLTSIIIPDSVANNGYCAFYGCSGLKQIYCRAISKPDGWDKDWDKKENNTFDGKHKVVWGYKGN